MQNFKLGIERGQKTELTGRSPLRSALDCNAIEEKKKKKEEEEEKKKKKIFFIP
jgi:hypothetical protein